MHLEPYQYFCAMLHRIRGCVIDDDYRKLLPQFLRIYLFCKHAKIDDAGLKFNNLKLLANGEIMNERLKMQFQFLIEIDKLKLIKRQTRLLCDKSRQENDAEHSWHLALYVMILREYSNIQDLDWLKVIRLVLIHDLVEIYAGDVFVYDHKMQAERNDREIKAANQLFSMLPNDQYQEIMGLWEEFESRSTPEAKFAAVVDRLQPFLHNYFSDGGTWLQATVTKSHESHVMSVIGENSDELGEFINMAIEEAVLDGRILTD
jgi:putative hydrolase of HD superfamily